MADATLVSGVCVGYVQQSCCVETIRIVQRPNYPKKKSNGGTTETARQKTLWSEKEGAAGRAGSSPGSGQSRFESRQQAEQIRVHAAGRAGSSLASGRFTETRRRQRRPVHSVSSTRASYNAK